jgi:hypothetical protein
VAEAVDVRVKPGGGRQAQVGVGFEERIDLDAKGRKGRFIILMNKLGKKAATKQRRKRTVSVGEDVEK